MCACGCDPGSSYVWNRMEQEALTFEDDSEYLKRRPCFNWLKFPQHKVAARYVKYTEGEGKGKCQCMSSYCSSSSVQVSL